MEFLKNPIKFTLETKFRIVVWEKENVCFLSSFLNEIQDSEVEALSWQKNKSREELVISNIDDINWLIKEISSLFQIKKNYLYSLSILSDELRLFYINSVSFPLSLVNYASNKYDFHTVTVDLNKEGFCVFG